MSNRLCGFPPTDKDSEFTQILEKVAKWSGCDFTRYNRGTMYRRIVRRIIDLRCSTLEEYHDYLRAHPEEYPRLMSALTIKVSNFFRDKEVFFALANTVIPRILKARQASGERMLRIWSTACARGEETYSIGILTFEYLSSILSEQSHPWTITILGTDIDKDALQDARLGIYSSKEVEHVPYGWRGRYFSRLGKGAESLWQVRSDLRETIYFLYFDLTTTDVLAPPNLVYAEYDLILCRNVLIYYQRDLKLQILRRLISCLTPNGYLVLGGSENLPQDLCNQLIPLDKRLKIYRKEGMCI